MRKGKISEEEKIIIKLMRESNKSYTEIARKLNCSKDRVKGYCQENGFGGYRANDLNPDNAYNNFIKNFNKTYGDRYLYLGGYTHSDNDVIIECKICHTQMSRNACTIRHDKPLNCEGCLQEQRDRETLIRILNKRISTLTREIKLKEQEEQRQKDLITTCQECGGIFQATSMGTKYCSKRCAARTHGRMKDINKRWRMRENGKVDKDISLTKLIKRDKGICHICNEKCDSKDYIRTERGHFIVGKDYPSINHIIPISRGGLS